MPANKSHFRDRWLSEVDGNGHELKLWCVKGKSDSYGHCTLCKTDIKCDNAELRQILQHAKGTQHKKLSKVAFSLTQAKLKFKPPTADENPCSTSEGTVHGSISESPASTSKQKQILSYSYAKDDVISAEVLWAAKCAYSNISFRANDGIGETFKAMFHCPIADGFSMSRTKLSYLLSDGLGPSFTKLLLYDVRQSSDYFSLQYVETTRAQVKKQMDLLIRYWSPTYDEVWCRYYKSLFFAHADGKNQQW